MAQRPLTPDEALLWQRVMDNVRPMAVGRVEPKKPLPSRGGVGAGGVTRTSAFVPYPNPSLKGEGLESLSWAQVLGNVRPLPGRVVPVLARQPVPRPLPQIERPTPPPALSTMGIKPNANTLDGSWDRQLTRGAVSPDSTVDLHGHTLQSAYAVLDEGLARAVRRGDRVLLLVTGKPPRPTSERPHARGAIRAAVGDWLARSRHAERIAAVRGAHPRHGGAGALYIILRRPKG